MSFNGSGVFQINTAGQPVVSGTVISSTAFNALTSDLATGLSTCITKDGQTTATANIPLGGFKLTGLGVGSAATDSPTLGQVQSTAVKLIASISGTNTITGALSPALTAYAAGQMFYFVSAGANTGAATLNINSLGAKSITKNGTTALDAGDIASGELVVVVYDGTQFQLINAMSTGDITFSTNTISTSGTNQNMVLDPNGTGAVLVNTSTTLYGNTAMEITAAGSNVYGLAVRSIADVREALAVWNNATSGNNFFVNFGTEGGFTSRGTINYNRGAGLVAYNTTSDYRCKDVYGPVTDSGAKVDALQVYRGKMHGATQERPMMIAHEAQAVTPYAVTGQKDAVNEHGQPVMQQIDYSTLVPLLVAEVQSLRARVAALGG